MFAPNGIQTIVLNRPEKANALSSSLLLHLEAALESARTDSNVRGIIITGSARSPFSVGADLEELLEFGDTEALAYLELGHRAIGKIERLGKPSLAAINGSALGGGLEIELAGSLRVAAEESMFGLPEITLGLIPGFGGTQRLPRVIGSGRAREMILTGNTCTAAEALQAGLITEVTRQDNLLRFAMTLLERVLRNPMQAVNAALTALGADDAEFEKALARERQLCRQQIVSPEAKRILARFIRKQAIARLTSSS